MSPTVRCARRATAAVSRSSRDRRAAAEPESGSRRACPHLECGMGGGKAVGHRRRAARRVLGRLVGPDLVKVLHAVHVVDARPERRRHLRRRSPLSCFLPFQRRLHQEPGSENTPCIMPSAGSTGPAASQPKQARILAQRCARLLCTSCHTRARRPPSQHAPDSKQQVPHGSVQRGTDIGHRGPDAPRGAAGAPRRWAERRGAP